MEVNLIQAQDEILLVEIARVSSSRSEEEKREEPDKLINYLIKNKHWSPFEHTYMTLEFYTSRAIATQFLRHRSFTFQQFSLRYAEATDFEPIEIREQADHNRQSSEDVFDPDIRHPIQIDTITHYELASAIIKEHQETTEKLYQELLDAGVAREVARFILPLNTQTRMYMTGNMRSWIHMIQLRDDPHAQKEAQLIAQECRKIFVEQFPITSKALGWTQDN